MSQTGFDRLAACQDAMIRALDGGTAAAVEAAAEALRAAVEALRAEAPAPHADHRPRLAALAAQASAAQARVNFLTDGIARRIDRIAEARGHARPGTYRASAR